MKRQKVYCRTASMLVVNKYQNMLKPNRFQCDRHRNNSALHVHTSKYDYAMRMQQLKVHQRKHLNLISVLVGDCRTAVLSFSVLLGFVSFNSDILQLSLRPIHIDLSKQARPFLIRSILVPNALGNQQIITWKKNNTEEWVSKGRCEI